MADDPKHLPGHQPDPAHLLPEPEARRGSTLGAAFADPSATDAHKLGEAFADPNSLDDARLGKAFEESNSSRKKKHKPIAERVHKPANRRPLYIFLICIVVLFALIFFLGWLPRHHRESELKKKAEDQKNAVPVVDTVTVKRAKSAGGLVIPGTTNALVEAFVYARANGYLDRRLVDIGDRVHKGQLLAVIDAPDLDQQVDQAREQVRQAESQLHQQEANLALAEVTVKRYRVLVAKGVFSRQDGDQREADFAAQQANVAAAQRNVEAFRANLRRVIALQSYERVTAPFDGVITQRNVDVGALISASGSAGGAAPSTAPIGQNSSSGGTQQAGQSNNAGASGSINTAATPAQSPGQGGPLFGIAQVDRLRILVAVPEGYAGAVRPGMQAKVAFQQYPQQEFSGDVTRTAGSVDQNTRTMLTEIQLDNHAGKLLPGMYAVATFPPVTGAPTLTIPSDAVAIRNDRTVVGVVVDGKARLVPVVIGRDYGPSVEILSGIREGDTLITNVTDDVQDGARVKPQPNKEQQQSAQQKPDQSQPPGGDSRYGNQGISDQNLQNKQTQQNQKGSGKQEKKPDAGSKP